MLMLQHILVYPAYHVLEFVISGPCKAIIIIHTKLLEFNILQCEDIEVSYDDLRTD